MVTVDWIILVFYLVGILVAGLIAGRYVKTYNDFAVGGMNFKLALNLLFSVAIMIIGTEVIASVSAIYTDGLSGIWLMFIYTFVTPLYWILAPTIRRSGAMNLGQWFGEMRYDKINQVVYGIIGTYCQTVMIGTTLLALGLTLSILMGIPRDTAIFICGAIVAVYVFAGGIISSAVTNIIQCVLVFGTFAIIIPHLLRAVGGGEGMRATLPPEFFAVTGEMFDVPMLIGLAIASFGMFMFPYFFVPFVTAKNELIAGISLGYGHLVKRLFAIFWAIIGLGAAAYFGPGILEDPDAAFGLVLFEVLPKGTLGLLTATLLAAVMSTMDSQVTAGSTTFVHNIYRLLKPNMNEQHYFKVLRFSTPVLLFAGIIIALYSPGLVEIFLIMQLAFFTLFTPWLGSIIWIRANRWGSLAATIGPFIIYLLVSLVWVMPYIARVLLVFSSAIILLIVVSLLTKPEPKEKLAKFYWKIVTPVEQQQKLGDIPYTYNSKVNGFFGLDYEKNKIFGPNSSINICWPSKLQVYGTIGLVIACLFLVWLLFYGMFYII